MSRNSLRTEVWLVLGVSLGASALWSVLRLLDLLTRDEGLGGATAHLNTPFDPARPWLSVAYDLVGVLVALVPAALALHLLGQRPGTAPAADGSVGDGARQVGLDLRRPLPDLVQGLGLAALIGLPGLALHLLAVRAGLNATVAPAAESLPWWGFGLLALAAVKNGLLEEVVVVGYLVTRCRQLGWSPWVAVGLAALLRGAYHLYQGFGAGLGNVVMGLVLGGWFLRTGRVVPLVVAHVVIDLVAFLGYAWLAPRVGWL